MFEWIVASSALILIVVLLRTILKGRVSLRLQYGLWAIVLVRLLVPFTFGESPFSFVSAAYQLPIIETTTITTKQITEVPLTSVQESDAPSFGEVTSEEVTSAVPDNGTPFMTQSEDLESVAPSASTVNLWSNGWELLSYLWYSGMILMAALLLWSNLRFTYILRKHRRSFEVNSSPLPIYISDRVKTPCLFGLLRPAIYLTPGSILSEERLSHILTHEETHFHHRDHIWALLRCVCLVLHWYNPLVWLAAVLSRRDCELACDEGTLARLGEDQRRSYGITLIETTCQGHGDLLTAATTMSVSKGSLRERITLIAKGVRMKWFTAAAVVLLCALAVGCGFTGGVSKEEQQKVETVKGFLTAFYTVPDSRWVDAERELWEIIAETGTPPKNNEENPIYKAVQEMFGAYVPEDSILFWYNTTNGLHSQSYDSQNDYAVIYSLEPASIEVTPSDGNPGSIWLAEVELIFTPRDGEPVEFIMEVSPTLDENGKITGLKPDQADQEYLSSLIQESLQNYAPLDHVGTYAWDALTILSTTPVEGIEEVRLAVLEGDESEDALFAALRESLSGIECTDQFLSDWLQGTGIAQLHQAAFIYGFTSEYQTLQMNMTENPLQVEYYLKTLVTNEYGKEKLVNIVGTVEFTEDGKLDAISVRSGLDAFLKTVTEFAEEGKPVEREWTEENRMRWSSEGAFDSISAEEAEGLGYEELAQLWAEKSAERYRNISSEENPLYCTDAVVLQAEPTAISLTSPEKFVFLYNLACDPPDENGFMMMQGSIGGYIDSALYPDYTGWLSAGSFIVVKQQQDGSWLKVSGGSGGFGGWGYLNLDQSDPETFYMNFDELLEMGELGYPESILRSLPFVNWEDFDAKYGEEGWQELTDLLMVYGLNGGRWYSDVQSWLEVYPEDQLFRNLYVMHGAIAAGEEFGWRFAPILQNQKNDSASDFDRSLTELTEEERSFIETLIN